MHFTVSGRGPAGGGGGARHRAVARTLLLGQHHAGQDRRHHHQPRDRAGLTGEAGKRRSDAVGGGRHDLAPAPRISQRTGAGRAWPPAASAPSAWRARRPHGRRWHASAWSAAGRRSRWPARCCSTWRSVSTTKPRLARVAQAARPAGRWQRRRRTTAGSAGWPGRPVRARRSVQARWSVSSRAAVLHALAQFGVRAVSACAWYSAWAQTSPTWLTRISAPDSGGLRGSGALRRVGSAGGAGAGGMRHPQGAQWRCQH
jgi:hypothetical protein